MAFVLSDLVDDGASAWPQVQQWLRSAHVQLFPAQRASGEAELLRLQVTTRTPMGAIALSCGGAIVHGGLVRLLGAGCSEMPRSISEWSVTKFGGGADGVPPPALWIADDVFGGTFAVNGGGIAGVQVGGVAYFCPSGLQWDALELGYSEFIRFLGSDNLPRFYEHVLWVGWEADVAAVSPAQCLSFSPPLFAECPRGTRSRHAVACEEAFSMLLRMAMSDGSGDHEEKAAAKVERRENPAQ